MTKANNSKLNHLLQKALFIILNELSGTFGGWSRVKKVKMSITVTPLLTDEPKIVITADNRPQ